MAVLELGRAVERALDDNASKKLAERVPREEVIRRILGEEMSQMKFAPVVGKRPARVVTPDDPEWQILTRPGSA